MDTNQQRANFILSITGRLNNEIRAAWKIGKSQNAKNSLLEISAGHGRDSKFFQDNGLQMTGIDLSPEMVRLCQQKGLDAHLMDMLELNFSFQSLTLRKSAT